MPCNLFLANEYKKEHINKNSKQFSDKVDRSQAVEKSDSEIVIAYTTVVNPKQVKHSEKSNFHHLNREGKGSNSINNISQPFSTTDQTES